MIWRISEIFEHVDNPIELYTTLQAFRSVQYGHRFPRWLPWATIKYYRLLRKITAASQKR